MRSGHPERIEEEIRRSLTAISRRPLDDLARARIQARLAGCFDRIAADRARPPRSGRRWLVAAVAAALVLLWLWPRDPGWNDARERHVEVGSHRRLGPGDRLEVGPGAMVHAELGGGGEVTLFGPGLAVVEAVDVLSLESGLVLVHVERPYQVQAGEVTVTVLGTRFAVERRDEAVRASVAEGRVEVRHPGGVEVLGAGDVWPRHAIAEPSPPPRASPRRREPPAETAESLYRAAEEALAAGRSDEARAKLEELAERFAQDPLADSALYELALLDRQEDRLEQAHARLIRLLARRRDPAFAEPGQRLLCQIDVETGRHEDANSCWRSFSERYPDSVHGAEALASLIGLAQLWNDCARVRSLSGEFLARYPEHPLRRDVEARRTRCAR